MATFWMTHRLEDDANYAQRYDNLVEAVRKISTKWWVEPTSFLLFSSERDIDGVAAVVKTAINPRVDMALIGMPDFKSARVVGASADQDLFELMPFTKKV